MRAGITPIDADGVRGFVHWPDIQTGAAIVLTHGAGGNCAAPLLVMAATTFCAVGIAVLRCDLPFRQRRPLGPPSPSTAAQDRDGLRNAVSVMRELGADRIVLGGQSYGGRQASMLAAEDPALVQGLLLFSYPLHPPGKPERLRTEHFPKLRQPVVFVSGTTDPFGSIRELQNATAAIPMPCVIIPIEGAGHDLRRGRFDWAETVNAILPLLSGGGSGRAGPAMVVSVNG